MCVLHNSVVSGPCSSGQDLDREYYCGHRWWTIPHLTVFVIYKPAKSTHRCWKIFLLSTCHSQLSITIMLRWITVTTMHGNTHEPKISALSMIAAFTTLNATQLLPAKNSMSINHQQTELVLKTNSHLQMSKYGSMSVSLICVFKNQKIKYLVNSFITKECSTQAWCAQDETGTMICTPPLYRTQGNSYNIERSKTVHRTQCLVWRPLRLSFWRTLQNPT